MFDEQIIDYIFTRKTEAYGKLDAMYLRFDKILTRIYEVLCNDGKRTVEIYPEPKKKRKGIIAINGKCVVIISDSSRDLTIRVGIYDETILVTATTRDCSHNVLQVSIVHKTRYSTDVNIVRQNSGFILCDKKLDEIIESVNLALEDAHIETMNFDNTKTFRNSGRKHVTKKSRIDKKIEAKIDAAAVKNIRKKLEIDV